LTAVAAALITVAKKAAGITDGEDPPPSIIDTAQLPFVYAFTRDGSYAWGETYEGTEDREFVLQVAVLPLSQGSPRERETLCRPIIDALRDTLASYPSLEGTTGVQDVTVRGASGPAILPEYAGKFIGFETRVTVRMRLTRTFAQGE
jgi:hypothetical protein